MGTFVRAMRLWPATGIAVALALNGAAVLAPCSARAGERGIEMGASGALHSEGPANRGDAAEPRPVGLMVNGRLSPDPVLIAGMGNALFVRRTDIAQAGLLLPGAPTGPVIAGEEYVALSAMAGLAASLEEGGDILAITASPELFPANTFGPSAQPVIVGEIVPAGFISYDLTFTRWNGENAAFGFLDAGVSGAWGLIGSTAVVQSTGSNIVRLDSYYQRDWPGERIRLVIGDAVTRATEWHQPVRFAGIRIGTDFALQPTLIAFPVPSLSGSATMPSAIDLASATGSQTLAVQPGAFAIDYQPVFSGAGEVTMTITDITGLSRRVTQSFYTSARLLRPGLADFSLEAGLVRENYGIASFDYGDPFAAGFMRLGLNRALTIGGRIEVSPDVRMGGLGLGWVLSPVGEFGLAGAVSDSALGKGSLWRAQFQRLAPTHAFTVSYQWDNGRFAQIGDAGLEGRVVRQPRRELALSGSLALGPLGDVILGHLESRTASGQSFRTTSLGLAGNLSSAFYNLGIRRTRIAEQSDNGAFLSVSMPLGPRSSASFRADGDRVIAMAALAPPTDRGAGYQLAAGYDARSGEPVIGVSSLIRTSAGDIELAGDRNGGGEGIRISARGALAAIGGTVVATPRLENAFALVELDSEEEVTLYFENRPVVARGGKDRTAIISGLQPYAENRIAIDVESLPITADVEVAEKLVVPGFRQAVRVGFGGATQNAVTVLLVDQDGVPLAAGLEVRLQERIAGSTGYDGMVFLPDLAGGERLAVSGRGVRCEARIPPAPTISESRQFGPVTCQPSANREDIR